MTFLPSRDRAYLASRGIAAREVDEGGRRGVILSGFPLPQGRYQAASADILILLPPGYPDCAPDMFYAHPRLVLAATGGQPRCTEAVEVFDGLSWQRWSRHSSEWRLGQDGLWTMIKRVELALEVAA